MSKRSGLVYWTDWSHDTIARAMLDGSDVLDIITEIRTPRYLALRTSPADPVSTRPPAMSGMPGDFVLAPAFPNPFRSSKTLTYTLPAPDGGEGRVSSNLSRHSVISRIPLKIPLLPPDCDEGSV